VDSALPFIVIKKDDDQYARTINEQLGELQNVFESNSFLSPVSPNAFAVVSNNEFHKNDKIAMFANWNTYAKQKNEQGRLPLFTALSEGVTWYDGVGSILKGNGAAIETVDVVTALQAFMVAGTSSSLETVFLLLQDHPAAIYM